MWVLDLGYDSIVKVFFILWNMELVVWDVMCICNDDFIVLEYFFWEILEQKMIFCCFCGLVVNG